jgi:hypothetical protein
MDNLSGGSAQPASPQVGSLDRRLCQVVGLNHNYTSGTGTFYHIQIEDRGPVMDRISEREVRRVNVIIYANYGEPNARIIFGRDHDFEDVRTQDHNRFIAQKIAELAAEARAVVEDTEQRMIARIKALIREYYVTKAEATKKEFESANLTFPFLFSRAWGELKKERPAAAAAALPVSAEPEPPTPLPETEVLPEEVLYPLDAELRAQVIDIERVIIQLGQDLQRLKAQGGADDILLQTCRKLVTRAKDGISGRQPSEFNSRRLDMTRNSLLTTWRQVRSRLR